MGNITSSIVATALAFGSPAQAEPSAAPAVAFGSPAPTGPSAATDLAFGTAYSLGVPGRFSASSALFKNIENYPGQVLMSPPRMSARQEGKLARRDAVRAARQAERTSEHIRGGIDRKTDMVVGASLRVRAQPDWELLGITDWEAKKPFAQACQRQFLDWAEDSRCLCDAEGHYNFGGLMWMAFRNLAGPDAECAGIIHYDEERQAEYNARWATFVQIIDPDRIETPPEHAASEFVHDGIRVDKWGRKIGMYVRNRHPAEGATVSSTYPDFTYVPRETYWGRATSFHWFVKTRGGQVRGITSLVNSLKQSGMLDSFDDAYLGAATLAQVVSTYIESMASPETVAAQLAPAADGRSPFASKLDYYDKTKIRIGGVRIPVMPPGDKIVMEAINRQVGDPTAFRNNFLRQFASAIGISFEQISNNFSDANYSAARAALMEIWRGINTLRKLFTAHVATLIYAAVIEEAIAKGRIELPPGAPPFQENRAAYTRCSWTGPGMGWIDPQKEANAIETLLRLKLTNRETEAASRGEDYLEIFDQIEQENTEADERGFDLNLQPQATMNNDPNAPADNPDGPDANQ